MSRRKNGTNRAAAALGISPNGWCNGKGRKRPREKKWAPPAATGKKPENKNQTPLL